MIDEIGPGRRGEFFDEKPIAPGFIDFADQQPLAGGRVRALANQSSVRVKQTERKITSGPKAPGFPGEHEPMESAVKELEEAEDDLDRYLNTKGNEVVKWKESLTPDQEARLAQGFQC